MVLERGRSAMVSKSRAVLIATLVSLLVVAVLLLATVALVILTLLQDRLHISNQLARNGTTDTDYSMQQLSAYRTYSKYFPTKNFAKMMSDTRRAIEKFKETGNVTTPSSKLIRTIY